MNKPIKKPKLSREQFEQSATKKLHQAVKKAKKTRHLLRQLEQEIADKKTKINGYQHIFSDLQKQLIELQSIIYAKGTT